MNDILIAHRNRLPHLAWCLWALGRAVRSVKCRVVVVDNGSTSPERVDELVLASGLDGYVIHDTRAMSLFNKSALLNRAIDETDSEWLTILDADALVGPRWAGAWLIGEHSEYHRIAYQVRYLPNTVPAWLTDEMPNHAEVIDGNEEGDGGLFDRYETYPLAWEAYRFPWRNRPEYDHQPWGNSQFSIRRDVLGECRFDERYAGKGQEDVDLNNQVWLANDCGRGLRCTIATGRSAMFHLQHSRETDWDSESIRAKNNALYREKWWAIQQQAEGRV